MKQIFFGVLFLLGSNTFAQTCQPLLKFLGETQVHRDSFQDGTCFLSIHTAHAEMVYRDYMLTSEGLLMVFNSYGEGESSSQTGAREFYFFPRITGHLDVRHSPDAKEVEVLMPNNRFLIFNSTTAQVKSLDGGTVSVATEITPKNRGGIEIKSYPGLYLDVGFTLGHSPSENRESFATFIDEDRRSCQVQNKEIFTRDSSNNTLFKMSDIELKAFLKNRCPQLKVRF